MICVGRKFFFDGFLAGWDLNEHMAVIKVRRYTTLMNLNYELIP
jgi:hypothetical protein